MVFIDRWPLTQLGFTVSHCKFLNFPPTLKNYIYSFYEKRKYEIVLLTYCCQAKKKKKGWIHKQKHWRQKKHQKKTTKWETLFCKKKNEVLS